ncbi:MAG: hypothetical protein ACREX0_00765 [Noviherbaspirillum sp.]
MVKAIRDRDMADSGCTGGTLRDASPFDGATVIPVSKSRVAMTPLRAAEHLLAGATVALTMP